MAAPFSRNTPHPDLEETVRRRILGMASESHHPASVEPPPQKPQADQAGAEEGPAQLLRRLAVALKREATELSSVKLEPGGFLVDGVRRGTAFHRWYSVQEVRQLAGSGGEA